MRYAEKSYFLELLIKKKGDAKGTWQILNNIINKKSGRGELPKQFESTGIIIVDKNTIANKFNEVFSTVDPKLTNSIPVLDNGVTIHDFSVSHRNINSIFLNPISEQKVFSIVKYCKPKNSKDCDELSMYVLSKVIETIVKPLAHIFNL